MVSVPVRRRAFRPRHPGRDLLPSVLASIPVPARSRGVRPDWVIVGHVIAAGWCMFGYAGSHGLGEIGATAAAISYMFAGKWMFHLLDAGHTVVVGLAWLPLVLLLLESAVRRGGLVRATAAGAAAGLMVLGTQPQWTFYSALLAAGLTLGTALESAGWLGGAGPRSTRRTLAALGRWLGLGLLGGADGRRPVRGAAAAHAGGGVAGHPRRRRGARRRGAGIRVHRSRADRAGSDRLPALGEPGRVRRPRPGGGAAGAGAVPGPRPLASRPVADALGAGAGRRHAARRRRLSGFPHLPPPRPPRSSRPGCSRPCWSARRRTPCSPGPSSCRRGRRNTRSP